MTAASKDTISGETVRKAVNALLKWKTKLQPKSHQNNPHQEEENEEEEQTDDFIYLTVTLGKIPPRNLTITPHRIPLRHSLLSTDYSQLKICLIIDGKKITHQATQNALKTISFPFTLQVMKLAKLKSDFKSFDSKKKLFNSFDVFFAVTNVLPFLPMVLGKMFYKKKRKIPFPVDLKADGSNWKEEIETACASSLLCLSSGTCCSVRVGRLGVTEGDDIMENVFEAIDGILEILPRKWRGIRCFHLKFSNSLALPIYEEQPESLPDEDQPKQVLVGKKRRRTNG